MPGPTSLLEALACERLGCSCQKAARNGSGQTHCPVHDDQTPSLSVSVDKGKVLVKCHAGCPQSQVIIELQKRGLWDKQGTKASDQNASGKATQYKIKNLAGAVVAIHFRQNTPDGKKMWWGRPPARTVWVAWLWLVYRYTALSTWLICLMGQV